MREWAKEARDSVLSVAPILALALVLQVDSAGQPAAAPASIDAAISAGEPVPAVADDPIGALMQQQEQQRPPAAAAPVRSVPATVPAPAQAPSMEEDEDAAEAHARLPSAPRPYTSLPPTATVRPNPTLFNNPMVRLRPVPAGSLDGGWVLARADGRKLYSFQFNDTGGGKEIEGAWRDLGQEWSTLGSGPVTSVGYEGSGVTIRFFEKGRSDMSVILLTRAASGDWTGEFQSKNGPTQVVMRRN